MEEEIEIFKIFKDTRKNSNRGALWEVSNYGNVRKNGEEYIPYETNSGYLAFSSYLVHRAVAEIFLDSHDKKPTVDHINRQKHDNRVSNLRWATYKEQRENVDEENLRMKLSESRKGKKLSEETKAKIGAAHLGYKYSEESKAKLRAAALGKVWVFNPTTEHSTLVNPSQLNDYLTKGYVKGRNPALGNILSVETRAKMCVAHLGRVWLFNPTTEQSTLVNPSQLNDYLAKGYVRGREKKVWVFNPTTAHSTMVNPSQLNEFLDKGYVRGRKPKK